MADPQIGAVPFSEAIAFFRQKLRLPTETWTDLWQGMHARAFVVAGATSDALLSDFRDAISKALEAGTTLAEFRRDFDAIVARHGWSYRGGRNWRSAVIYNTNLRMAYQAGRWAQIRRLADRRPFIRYSAVLDDRTRPMHRAWHGTILPVDDPFWNTHAPPNGWNCRCSVTSLSQRDLARYGYQVSDRAPAVQMEPRQVNTAAGPVSVDVPAGIDTGFGYNVGDAAWGRGAQRVAMEKHGPWTALQAPGGPRPVNPGLLAARPATAGLGRRVRPGDEAGLRDVLRKAIGGDDVVMVDPAGGRVAIGQAMADHIAEDPTRWNGREAFFPLIRELVEDPDEIWIGFASSAESGRVALRRRYVRLFDLGRRRVAALVADADGRNWSGMTFFAGRNITGAIRTGLRLFNRMQG